jgi:hypothetical protein
MRWVGGYGLLASAICLFIAIATVFGAIPVTLATGLAVLLYAAALHLGLRPVAASWNILLAFAGNAVGAWKALRGERMVTWEPPASARRARLGQGVAGR